MTIDSCLDTLNEIASRGDRSAFSTRGVIVAVINAELTEMAYTETITGFRETLDRLGISDAAVAGKIDVGAGTTAYLTTDERATATASRLLVTDDLDRYKQWIGRPDEVCADVRLELPEPWQAGTSREYGQLTAAERHTLEVAGKAYLFGDSRRVPGYREVLETYRAPFIAAVYAARRVEIAPGASLIADGTPAVLIFEELVLHDTGRLITMTATNAIFGRLHKITGERTNG
jgi:hypothetical protein